ncbi:serine O-acetyltransferase [Pseudomonas aeruginosa]|nr:serine O-acetyltransferase [Pseudomonas aeruginosa]MDF5858264.1 serine O-acetyltransferase [Pseudomonas aeruginosa]MDF5927036.1 serine O-acetyltransferase [Pseudomonas aeruginosa]
MRNSPAEALAAVCTPTASVTCVWQQLQAEARRAPQEDSVLGPLIDRSILCRSSFWQALSSLLSAKLSTQTVSMDIWLECFADAHGPEAEEAAKDDLAATLLRDPAAENLLVPFLCYKGFHALQCHRVARQLWNARRRTLARLLQSRVSEVFGVDIHPAVPVGRRVFIDHATGIVIGETASIGNDVSILQKVTLGGTGKEYGDRHPKIRDRAFIAAGATILGNIEIGFASTVGAGSVVLEPVPPYSTVVGVPARILRTNGL